MSTDIMRACVLLSQNSSTVFYGLVPLKSDKYSRCSDLDRSEFFENSHFLKKSKDSFFNDFLVISKNIKYMTLCWHIKWYLSWMGALEYVSCINLTSALGYVSHTNQITAMRYACTNQSVTVLSLMPITS